MPQLDRQCPIVDWIDHLDDDTVLLRKSLVEDNGRDPSSREEMEECEPGVEEDTVAWSIHQCPISRTAEYQAEYYSGRMNHEPKGIRKRSAEQSTIVATGEGILEMSRESRELMIAIYVDLTLI